MRHFLAILASFAVPITFLACPSQRLVEPPHTVTTTDAGDYPFPPDYAVEEYEDGTAAAALSPCGQACEAIRKVGCPEGFPDPRGVTCYRACLSMARHQRVPTSCWISRTTQAGVRQCGGIQCLGTDASASPSTSRN